MAFSLLTQHPTRVAALPADLRPAAGLAGQAEITHVVFSNCYRDYAQVNAGQLAALLQA